MNLQSRTVGIDEVVADLLVLPICQGEGPLRGGAALVDWRLEGRLSGLLRQGRLAGRSGERVLLLNLSKLEAPAAWLEGLGEAPAGAAWELARRLWDSLKAGRRAGARRVAVAADELVGPGRPFASLTDLAHALEAQARSDSEPAPEDVTLTFLDQQLF